MSQILGCCLAEGSSKQIRVEEGKVYDIMHRTKFFHEFDPVRSSDWPLRGRSIVYDHLAFSINDRDTFEGGFIALPHVEDNFATF